MYLLEIHSMHRIKTEIQAQDFTLLIEFVTAQVHILHTKKSMQCTTCLVLKASCLSFASVEVKGDASQSTMSLDNIIQTEALLEIECTQTCLSSWEPDFKRPYTVPPLLLPICIVSTFLNGCVFGPRSYWTGLYGVAPFSDLYTVMDIPWYTLPTPHISSQ
jgi:hypothetical protein